MEISWPNVRQVILNDRINGYKPDRACLNKISSLLPDANVFGFGKYYEYHWYVLICSQYFPYHIEPDLRLRGAIPLSSLINYLPQKGLV